MKTVTLRNDFHNTTATVRAGIISPTNAKRIARKLCGVSGCSCGGSLGTRGQQRTADGKRIAIEQTTADGYFSVSVES